MTHVYRRMDGFASLMKGRFSFCAEWEAKPHCHFCNNKPSWDVSGCTVNMKQAMTMKFLEFFHSTTCHRSNSPALVCLHWELADAAIQRLVISIANTPANPANIFIFRQIKCYKLSISWYGITMTFSNHFPVSNLYSVSMQTLDLTSWFNLIEFFYLHGWCQLIILKDFWYFLCFTVH